MNYKKIGFFFLFAFLAISLTGCGVTKVVQMDELTSKNIYPYKNADLGFSLNLPADFIYFQTQRNNNNNFSDLDIYIPTSDKDAQKELSGYAKPISVRVFDKKYWYDSLNDTEKANYTKIGEKNNRVYGVLFWNQIPSDWTAKWTEEMKQEIIKGFKSF